MTGWQILGAAMIGAPIAGVLAVFLWLSLNDGQWRKKLPAWTRTTLFFAWFIVAALLCKGDLP